MDGERENLAKSVGLGVEYTITMMPINTNNNQGSLATQGGEGLFGLFKKVDEKLSRFEDDLKKICEEAGVEVGEQHINDTASLISHRERE